MPDLPDLKPKVLQAQCTNQEDLYAVVQKVCNKLSAVKKASSEASVAARRPEEPEVRGAAALLQQTDRSSSGLWPACFHKISKQSEYLQPKLRAGRK